MALRAMRSSLRSVAAAQLRFPQTGGTLADLEAPAVFSLFRRCFASAAQPPFEEPEDAEQSKLEAYWQQAREEVICAHAPPWLPLLPGGAYWVHPSALGDSTADRRREIEETLRNAEQVVEMSEEQELATMAGIGWPDDSVVNEVLTPSPNDATRAVVEEPLSRDTSPLQAATKRTYQPHVIRRKRKHGFFARKSSKGGQRVLARRLLKGRRKLSA